MRTAPSQTFTAAKIAAAWGKSKRRVLEVLERFPADGSAVVRGKATPAWTVARLPVDLRDKLAGIARQRGYRDTEHLLSDPPVAWQPAIDGKPVAVSEIAEHCITLARRLQRALMPSVVRASGEAICTAAQLEARGLADYRAEFKHTITGRHWRQLLERTIDRDAGAQDFGRLELYLPEQLARRVEKNVKATGDAARLEHVRKALDLVRLPDSPTREELEFVWDSAFLELRWLADEAGDQRQAKRAVFTLLAGSCVRLAKSHSALERIFSLKWNKWLSGDCKPSALRDNRSERSGNFRAPELPEKDRIVLVARATERDGSIAPAWREARDAGELSPETEQRFLSNPHSKSHVPRAIRDAIKHDVAMLDDLHHGPRQSRLRGPYISRDYSDITPGDWHQGDDCTLPVYIREMTPTGETDLRGQFLPLVDVKTGYIYGFAFHSDRNYTAAIIRSLLVRVHDGYGLPRQGYYFENGLWKRSRLLVGRSANEITMDETEVGLREYVRFMHARMPKAKVIEGILGILQNYMNPLPGYVGRNEQSEKFERIQKQLIAARAGRIPYESFLYTRDQWITVLEEICERYNHTPQEGRLQGKTPHEAYEQGFDHGNPLTKLPKDLRYLLANHRRRERVSRQGIRIIWGGKSYTYCNDATGRLRGQEVLVWFDPEERPESITITDMERRNPVEVPRFDALPSMTATPEQLRAAHAQASSHLSYARTLYKIIAPHFARNMFRPVLADAATIEMGRQIAAGREQLQTERSREQNLAKRIATAEREVGARFAKPHRNSQRKLDGLEMLRRADELERQQGGQL